MGRTSIGTRLIRDDSVNRDDVDINTVGKSLITKVIEGSNINISWTGADAGTGDVTINAASGGGGDYDLLIQKIEVLQWMDF